MAGARIATVIGALRAEVRGEARLVTFHFHGDDTALGTLGRVVRRARRDALLEAGEGHLGVLVAVRVEPEALARVDAEMAGRAERHGVEYDGFEVMVGDAGAKVAVPAFSRAQAPGEAFAWAVPDGRWAYGLFVGGDAREGHLYRFFRRLDPAEARPDAARLAGAEDLYPQPVLGAINPGAVIALGPAPEATRAATPGVVRFRCGVGWPGPEEVDALYREAGVDPGAADGWPALLAWLAARGRTLRTAERWMLMTARLDGRGRLRWDADRELPEDAPMPDCMTFATVARLEWVTAALTGRGHDLLGLQEVVLG